MYTKKPHWCKCQWGFCVSLWGDVGESGKGLTKCLNGGVACYFGGN